jgi:hypothetical protein
VDPVSSSILIERFALICDESETGRQRHAESS